MDGIGLTAMRGKLHKLTVGSSERVHGMGGTELKDNCSIGVSFASNLLDL
jgi:hypothetical protein